MTMEIPKEKPWHALEIEEVFKDLNSSESGLNEKEVKERLKTFGPNTLKIKSSETIPKNSPPPTH